jgi:phosphomevalonate kinase
MTLTTASAVALASSEHGCIPRAVIVLSGKRKAGKDYIADLLVSRFCPGAVEVARLSAPLKWGFAREHGLDYEKLLTAGPFKEEHRLAMIAWGEDRRREDPAVFARQIVQDASRPLLVVTDARRTSDLAFFRSACTSEGMLSGATLLTVRIEASIATRTGRGWVFTKGVDDAESELGLDDCVAWDFVLQNDDGKERVLKEGIDVLEKASRRAAGLCV